MTENETIHHEDAVTVFARAVREHLPEFGSYGLFTTLGTHGEYHRQTVALRTDDGKGLLCFTTFRGEPDRVEVSVPTYRTIDNRMFSVDHYNLILPGQEMVWPYEKRKKRKTSITMALSTHPQRAAKDIVRRLYEDGLFVTRLLFRAAADARKAKDELRSRLEGLVATGLINASDITSYEREGTYYVRKDHPLRTLLGPYLNIEVSSYRTKITNIDMPDDDLDSVVALLTKVAEQYHQSRVARGLDVPSQEE